MINYATVRPQTLAARLALIVLTGTIVLLSVAAGGAAAEPPVKLIPSSRFGREVNLTQVNARAGAELEDICTVASGDTCQPGTTSTVPGGFNSPEDVAVNQKTGGVYVADWGNNRVQEFDPQGKFILMFGAEVNETIVNSIKSKGGTPTQEELEEENICTAASGDICKVGKQGTLAGEMTLPGQIAVDQVDGNIYVAERDFRISEFTEAGKFVLMVGREVNATTKGNLCTAQESNNKTATCKGGVRASENSTEHNAFGGPLLAVGPQGTLYVADKGQTRVQEIDGEGNWKGEIALPKIVASAPFVGAVAADNVGDIYLSLAEDTSEGTKYIREFDASGREVGSFEVAARNPGADIVIEAMTFDPAGRLALAEHEEGPTNSVRFGSLYDVSTGVLITEFITPGNNGPSGLAFDAAGEMYATISPRSGSAEREEVVVYAPFPVAELSPNGVSCVPGISVETLATLDCALNGLVNPWGVSDTEAWVQWGRTVALGSETPVQSGFTGSSPVSFSAQVDGLRPNESSFYRLAAHDEHVKRPELLMSATTPFTTPIVSPDIIDALSVPFVRASSAVMSGKVNPENASTRYEFQYGACESLEGCATLASTPSGESAIYGQVEANLEARDLQPGTLYHYRLVAQSENTAKTERLESKGPEASFTTLPAPKVGALTGSASNVTPTSAVITGSVNPDGQPALYKFELGVYTGGATQYGVVFAGAVPASDDPVEEELGLTGLQPGVIYSYRVAISSPGYGGTVLGAAQTFTTEGLPSVLVAPASLALLVTPSIVFPQNMSSPPGKKAKLGGKKQKQKQQEKKKTKGKKSSVHKRKADKSNK